MDNWGKKNGNLSSIFIRRPSNQEDMLNRRISCITSIKYREEQRLKFTQKQAEAASRSSSTCREEDTVSLSFGDSSSEQAPLLHSPSGLRHRITGAH